MLTAVRTAGDEPETYIVPGTVTAGVHDPADVGVLVVGPEPVPGARWFQIGDWDDDGAQDLTFGPDVLSGRLLIGAGPGGSVRYETAVLESGTAAPGVRVAPLALEGADPVLVQARAVGEEVVIDVPTNPPLTLRTGAPAFGADTAAVSGFRSAGHRIISLSRTDRGGPRTWLWDIDEPCRGVAAAAQPGPLGSVPAAGSATPPAELPATGFDAAEVARSAVGAVVLGLAALGLATFAPRRQRAQ